MELDKIIELLKSDDYKERAKGEYYFVKDKYEKLHRAIIRREAGTLVFESNCTLDQWKSQAKAMGEYLYHLELKAAVDGINLWTE